MGETFFNLTRSPFDLTLIPIPSGSQTRFVTCMPLWQAIQIWARF
jgi:hypothetical protein